MKANDFEKEHNSVYTIQLQRETDKCFFFPYCSHFFWICTLPVIASTLWYYCCPAENLSLLSWQPNSSLRSFPKVTLLASTQLMERGFLWIIKHSLHLYGSEMFLGTKDNRPNTVIKDALTALTSQEISRVWEAVS